MLGSEVERLDAVEQQVRELALRVRRMEAEQAPAAPYGVEPRCESTPPPSVNRPPRVSEPPRPARAPAPRPAASLEDVLGGKLLAIVGGIAVVLGIAFFLALAIDHGWISEGARTLLAFIGSAGMLGAGVWLQSHRERTLAAVAAAGSGIAGLYLTLVAATQLYDLLPAGLALPGAVCVGAIATVLAIRLESQTLAGLGILGGLLAPALVGATLDTPTVAFLGTAQLAAAAVLVWRRWQWLGFASMIVTAPQVGIWLFDAAMPFGIVIASLAFWLLWAGTGIGYELRVPRSKLTAASALLVSLAGIAAAAGGALTLNDIGEPTLAKPWLVALAASHLAAGLRMLRSEVRREIGILALGLGVVLGDVAFALLLDGPVVTAGWAATGIAFALLARRHPADRSVLGTALATHLALALTRSLIVDAPLDAIDGAARPVSAFVGLVVVVVAAFACARIATGIDPRLRQALDVTGIATLAYMTAVTLDGVPMTMAWTAEALVLARIGNRGSDAVARYGSFGLIGLGAAHAFVIDAPATALLSGVDNLGAAAVVLAAVAGAAGLMAREERQALQTRNLVLEGLALNAIVYLGSVAITTAFPSGAAIEFGVRDQAQAILSAYWALSGLGVLVWGLVRADQPARLAGLGLLGLTVGKVFLFDLGELDSGWRALSFVGLGGLLLVAAYAYQRLQPRIEDGQGQAA